MTSGSVDACAWPQAKVGAGLSELVRRLGWQLPEAHVVVPSEESTDGEQYLRRLATSLRVELKHTSARYVDLARVISTLGPSVLELPRLEDRVYLLILRTSKRGVVVLCPDLSEQALPIGELHGLVSTRVYATVAGPVDTWLTCIQPDSARRLDKRERLASVILENAPVDGLYVLRHDTCGGSMPLLEEHGVLRLVTWTMLVSVVHVLVGLLGWMLLGTELSAGPLEGGWVDAWIITQATTLVLQLIVSALGCNLVTKLTLFLKQRLLLGTLRLDAERIRQRGAGHWLGMVFEANVLESAGLAGGFAGLLAVFQLGSAAVLIALGANGGLQLVLMLAWCVMLATLIARLAQSQSRWTAQRLKLAQHFVENVIGNRTRMVQQEAAEWHVHEDALLTAHLASHERMDALRLALTTVSGRGWLVVSFVSLSTALLLNDGNTYSLAVTLGGALQAQMAFGAIGAIAPALVSAGVAWRHLRELFRAAENPDLDTHSHSLPTTTSAPTRGDLVLDLQGIKFTYPGRSNGVLQACDLRVHAGDRLLLEGGSGSGKSTLASLLSGLRQPSQGCILLHGYDYRTLGPARWCKHVATAPQFHENHVLSASLAFNLLMGRAWPPSEQDLAEAEEVCRSLDLGPLLDRMPSGLHQAVGDTGWQLSHGERSRVFLARAMLQGAHAVVLDESFGALDAGTLDRCLTSVFTRIPTVMVIAHP